MKEEEKENEIGKKKKKEEGDWNNELRWQIKLKKRN